MPSCAEASVSLRGNSGRGNGVRIHIVSLMLAGLRVGLT